ncbi:MAG: hypothetical protein JRE64_11800 [Deltaproteobacteria bacterium]|nr:hypothetical protein [Deltaproteobacteria bacterium]MBW2739504.1 hypothetical protein [Deltaproteobacteria bacterium]
MTKRLSSAAIVALKEALCSIYWYKADLRSFFQNSLATPTNGVKSTIDPWKI